MNEEKYHKLVKYFGLYHGVAVAPLVFPKISNMMLTILGSIHEYLGFQSTWLSFGMNEMMFINLFASAAFVWAVYRFLYPSYAAGKIEGYGMLLFSFIIVFYVSKGVSPIWLIIPLADIPGGLAHLYFSKAKNA